MKDCCVERSTVLIANDIDLDTFLIIEKDVLAIVY